MGISIQNPSDLHKKVLDNIAEVPLEETGVYQTVSYYLEHGMGIMLKAIQLEGVVTQEYLRFYVSSLATYIDGIRLLKAYYDAGYYVHVSRTANCSLLGIQDREPCAMVISWDPRLIRMRQKVCPCIVCCNVADKKVNCPGCDAWRTWQRTCASVMVNLKDAPTAAQDFTKVSEGVSTSGATTPDKSMAPGVADVPIAEGTDVGDEEPEFTAPPIITISEPSEKKVIATTGDVGGNSLADALDPETRARLESLKNPAVGQ